MKKHWLVVVVASLIVLLLGTPSLAQTTAILQPGPGLNDGNDDGTVNKGKDGSVYPWPEVWPSFDSAGYPELYLFNSPCNITGAKINPSPGFLQFSLVGMPQVGITSATIEVYAYVYFNGAGSPWPAGNYQVSLRRITSAWSETGVSTYTQPTYDSAILDSHVITTVGGSGNPYVEFEGWLSFDMTGLYKGWASGSIPNQGVAFVLDTPFCQNGDIFSLYTSDYTADPSRRPKLVVNTANIVKTTNVSITLYNNPTTDQEKAPYENIIRYFADGLYESSNGAHQLATVTFHTSNGNADQADVIWVEKCHPNANISGYGVSGWHVNMCDIFTDGSGPGNNYNFLSDEAHQKGGGYTLAHEWGHYYYSLYDEYTGDESYDDEFYFPHSTDKAVKNSVMNHQWNALNGDLNWLNFSVAKNDTRATAQFRVYGAPGWETLKRPVSEDPREGTRTALPKRLYHEELLYVAPGANMDAAINLPGDARKALNIVWDNSASSPFQIATASALPFTAQLVSIEGQNISYPKPILLLAFVHKDLTIADAGVQGSIQLPDGSTKPVIFADDGIPPDAVKGDGQYSAIVGYDTNGLYTVNVQFDNNAGTAKFVATAFQPSIGADGRPVPLSNPVLVGENFSASKTLQLLVSNVSADDYGNTPATAQAITTDNVSLPGRIDYPGDKDVFRLITLDGRLTFVRVTSLALGITPRMRVLGADGTTVLFEANEPREGINYLLIPLLGIAPGTALYSEVSDKSGSASGGLYEVSVGSRLPKEFSPYLYLPIIIH